MANTPSSQNYTLGKGVLYFDKLNKTTGKYEGARDMGNSPEVSMSISPEKLEHFSSRGGLKVKDKTIVSEMAMTVSFSLDEPNNENLALMFMADQETVTQAAQTSVVKEISEVTLGRYYNLDFKKVTVATVVDAAVPATEFTAGTDFTVDSKNGRLFIPFTSTITPGLNLTVTYSAEAAEYTKLKALNQPELEGSLRFISDNPVGENYDMHAWRVSITPSGDLGLVGDDWMTLSFECEVLKDQESHPDSPYMDIVKL